MVARLKSRNASANRLLPPPMRTDCMISAGITQAFPGRLRSRWKLSSPPCGPGRCGRRVRAAGGSHDVATLKTMMTEDFGYRLSPEASGSGVFQYWDDQGLWPELQGILSEKFVKKGDFMVAPPQFANPALNYDGYRAGIHRVNGSWKFAYFVNG